VGGQIIRIYGADNPDAIRGAYFDGVVLDEFADMRSTLR
jgi:phage terminase large subunit